MRRTLAAAALLVTVAAAPMTGSSEAFAQAPSLGSMDPGNPPSIDMPAIGAQANLPAGIAALSRVKSSTSSVSLPVGVPVPRMDGPAPQLPSPASLPPSETPASQPALVATPGAPSEGAVVSRDEPEIAPVTDPTTRSAETAGEMRAAPSAPSATRDLGAWIPGVTVPNDEPAPERWAAPPAPVTAAPAFAVPAPAWISTHPPAETVVERDSADADVVEDAAPAVSEPDVPDTTVPRGASVISLPSIPLTAAFVPPVTATSATAMTAAVSPTAGEGQPSIVEDAAAANSAAIQATQSTAELPRIRSAASVPVLDIPALASIEMPGGLHLSLFAALFGALGSAALGLHLLLRRIESTL
jgi:hypothetical protein